MSLTTAVRSINRSAKSKFPGASDSDVAAYVGLVYQAAVTNLKSTYKDEDAVASADSELAEAAERGDSWAVSLRDAKLLNIIKPIVDKAKAKGVDPVTALLLEDFGTEEARGYVVELESRETDSDDEPEVEADGDDDFDSFENDAEPVGSSI